MKLVEDSCLLPKADQNHSLSFLLLITFRLWINFLMVFLAPRGEVSCVCGCQCRCGTSYHNPCSQTHGQYPAKLYASYALAKT